jgi:peroxiredoxin Q/BCP
MKPYKNRNLPKTLIPKIACITAVCLAIIVGLGGCNGRQNGKISLSPPTLQEVEDIAASFSDAIGKPAPAFSLPDQNGRTVSLASLQGAWIVLYFYPMDDTPGCACEATEFTHLLAQFRQMNARIFGVSADSVESHQAFREKYDLTLDLLSDPEGQVMRQYGAFVDTRMGDVNSTRIIRSTYLIDPTGHIAYHWPEVIPQGHAERVRQKLAQLQAR